MTATSQRLPLAVALGAAAGAYVSAFVAAPFVAAIAGIAYGVAVWTLGRRRSGHAPSALLASVVRILLLTTGSIAVTSRNLPLLPDSVATTGALVAGGLLLASGLVLAREARPAHAGLVPAALGLLVAAALQPGQRSAFVAFACVSGAALWAWGLAVGGPRPGVAPLALFLALGGGLAWGAALFLPWAQPHVEAWVAGVYAEGQTGLSGRSELGEVETLARSRRVVARVWTSEPELLRMQVFTTLRGSVWTPSPPRWRDAPRVTLPRPAGPILAATPGAVFRLGDDTGRVVDTRVLPSLFWDDGWSLLVPSHPARLRAPVETVKVDGDRGLVDPGIAAPAVYAVSSGRPSSVAPEPPPDDPTRDAAMDPRIRDLASSIGGSGTAPRETLDRTVTYLRTRYAYTLEHLPPSVEAFLFDGKAGNCEYFATAAVLLLRAQGIAARYVRGVRVDAESRVGDHYVVRESDAHAWIEAWLPGEGWVEADPTPAARGASGSGLGALGARWEAFESWILEARVRLRESGWPALREALATALDRGRALAGRPPVIAAAVGLVVVAGLARMLRRRVGRLRSWARGPASDGPRVDPDLRDLVRRLEQRWARGGRPRPPSRGLREHVERPGAGTESEAARAIEDRVVAAYYAARYGDTRPTAEEIRDLRALLDGRNAAGRPRVDLDRFEG